MTAVALGSAVYLLKSDVRHGGAMLKRNLKTIRSWLEEEAVAKPGYVALAEWSAVCLCRFQDAKEFGGRGDKRGEGARGAKKNLKLPDN